MWWFACARCLAGFREAVGLPAEPRERVVVVIVKDDRAMVLRAA